MALSSSFDQDSTDYRRFRETLTTECLIEAGRGGIATERPELIEGEVEMLGELGKCGMAPKPESELIPRSRTRCSCPSRGHGYEMLALVWAVFLTPDTLVGGAGLLGLHSGGWLVAGAKWGGTPGRELGCVAGPATS